MQIEAIKSISQSNISIARLIKIMKANKNDSKIIEKCCNRIRELANNEENRIEIGRTDGVKVVLQSMRIHIDVALVVELFSSNSTSSCVTFKQSINIQQEFMEKIQIHQISQ